MNTLVKTENIILISFQALHKTVIKFLHFSMKYITVPFNVLCEILHYNFTVFPKIQKWTEVPLVVQVSLHYSQLKTSLLLALYMFHLAKKCLAAYVSRMSPPTAFCLVDSWTSGGRSFNPSLPAAPMASIWVIQALSR